MNSGWEMVSFRYGNFEKINYSKKKVRNFISSYEFIVLKISLGQIMNKNSFHVIHLLSFIMIPFASNGQTDEEYSAFLESVMGDVQTMPDSTMDSMDPEIVEITSAEEYDSYPYTYTDGDLEVIPDYTMDSISPETVEIPTAEEYDSYPYT